MKTKAEAMKDLRKVHDKRITLARRDSIPDKQAGREPKFVPVASVWADMRLPRLTQTDAAGDVVSEATQEFRIWQRSDVRRGWQVQYGKRKFKVLHVYNPNSEKTALICQEITR